MRGRGSDLVTSAELNDWVVEQTSGPWIELLSEAVEEFELETSGAETSVDHFIEWLAEWGRETRRRQRGLMLTTAHRAKGLEFDHVVVLDGGWGRVGRGERIGCSAPPVLCGHDARTADPNPRTLSRAEPTPRCLDERSLNVAPPSIRQFTTSSVGTFPSLPAAQLARSFSELLRIQGCQPSGPSRDCCAIARRSVAGTDGSKSLGTPGSQWYGRGTSCWQFQCPRRHALQIRYGHGYRRMGPGAIGASVP